VAALAGLSIFGCRPADRDTLVTVRTIPVPEAFTSLHVDGAGFFWLGGGGEILKLDPDGRELARLRVPEASNAELADFHADRLYFRTPSSILLVDARESRLLVENADLGAGHFLADVRGRFVLRTAGEGAVIAHDPLTLEPVWGWGAVGARATALALSPEGDRIYLALGARAEGGPELLVRDVQTGRVLRRRVLRDSASVVIAGGPSMVFAFESDARGGGQLEALQWRAGELEPVWSRSQGELRIDGSARMRLSRDGRRLAVLGLQKEEGLHLLEVEAGRYTGRLRGNARDVAFGPAGEVYLLYSGELRRVE